MKINIFNNSNTNDTTSSLQFRRLLLFFKIMIFKGDTTFLLEMQILHFTLELRILANVSLVTLPGGFFKNNSKSQNGIFGDFYFDLFP